MITELAFTPQEERHLNKVAPELGILCEHTGQNPIGNIYRLTFDRINDIFYLATSIAVDVTLEKMDKTLQN